MSDTPCWCGTTHDWESKEVDEALRNLGHLILTELHIPQLVDWINNKINQTNRREERNHKPK